MGEDKMRRKEKNEKKVIFVFACVVVLCGALLFTNCATTRIDVSGIVGRNSRYAGRLEATVASLDGAIVDSRERIADSVEQSKSIADGLERLEFLFGRYEQEVGRLLEEIGRIRSQVAEEGEDNSVGGSPFVSVPVGAGDIDNTESEIRN